MLIVDLILLVVASFIAISSKPRVVRAVSILGTYVFLSLVLVLALTGFTLMRKRVGRSDLALTPRTPSAELTFHRAVGFTTEAVFSFTWPCLLLLPFRVRSGRVKRILVVVAAVMLFFTCSLVAVSAYMLPRVGSVSLPPPLAATILRFAILHVTVGPALATILFIALAVAAVRGTRVAAG
jgi:hypothetical protein